MALFRRILYGCIVAVCTVGGLAVLLYALYLLPVNLHLLHPASGMGAWVSQHSLNRAGKIGMGLLIVTIFWPIAMIVFEIATFLGLGLAAAVDTLFGTQAHKQSGSGTVFSIDPNAVSAYAAAHGFSTNAQLSDADKQSVFLNGDSANVTPLVQGTIRGRDFTWYQTTDDVYAVRLDRTFPHIYIRSRLNPDNRGLAAGHIGDVTPITLEADFGRYFTAYAAGSEAQVTVRELLTPDIMLAMLLSAPTADFEFLGQTMFVSLPRAAASDAAATAKIAALEPVVSQLLQEGTPSFNPLSQTFRPPRFHINLSHLADKTVFTSLKLIGLFFLFVILGSLAGNLPRVGSAVSMVILLIGVACVVLCAVLTVGLVYAAALYATFNALRSMFISARVHLLAASYQRAYPQTA